MVEQVGVSASTVRNRIGRMEEREIVRGHHPDVDPAVVDTKIITDTPVQPFNRLGEHLVEVDSGE